MEAITLLEKNLPVFLMFGIKNREHMKAAMKSLGIKYPETLQSNPPEREHQPSPSMGSPIIIKNNITKKTFKERKSLFSMFQIIRLQRESVEQLFDTFSIYHCGR